MGSLADAAEPAVEGELITLKYVPLRLARFWDRNPKKHDLPKLVESIAQHGFKDPPAYDLTLDGFVEGNGRTEALQWMAMNDRPRPRGIAIDVQTGEWCMPVLFGVDARSRQAAERYGIDHNNLVLAGGGFSAVELARNWEPAYLAILQEHHVTHQIADEVQRITGSDDVVVVGEGSHLCMEMRGIKTPARMTSSVVRGRFRDLPALRAEAIALMTSR